MSGPRSQRASISAWCAPPALTLLLLAASSPADGALPGLPPAPAAPAGAAATGSIAGSVRFAGELPEPRVYSLEHDAFCMSSHGAHTAGAHRLVLDDSGAVQWAFVYIGEVVEGDLPVGAPRPATLDKIGCAYQPHVLGMQAGATLHILNSDPTLHTVQLEAVDNPSFNIALPRRGMDIVRVLETPEVMIPVRCNVHPWTQAYVGVVPHSFFAVTGPGGRFLIDDVPAGEYVLEMWHEILGRDARRVTVTDGRVAEVGFSFDQLSDAGRQD